MAKTMKPRLNPEQRQALAEREDLESIRRGIEQMEDGKGRQLSEVDAEIRQKLGFSPRS